MPCRKKKTTKLPDKVLDFLQAQGITFTDWCKQKGFNYICARDVAVGRTLGWKGNALKIKLALREEYAKLEEGGPMEIGKKEKG